MLFPNSDRGLHPDEVTLADMLKDAGYRTACVGKWHLGHLPPCLPTYQGFDSYWGIPYSNDMWIDPANRLAADIVIRDGLTLADLKAGHKAKNVVPILRNEEVIEYPADQTTITRRYTEEAIRFINEKREQPFFLYLPHTMVHLPLAVSKAFDNPDNELITNAIEEVDWSVGEILKIGQSGRHRRQHAGRFHQRQRRRRRFFAAASCEERQRLRRRHSRAHADVVAGQNSRRLGLLRSRGIDRHDADAGRTLRRRIARSERSTARISGP